MDDDIASPGKLRLDSLRGEHRDIAARAIQIVLSSPIAESTYGQIVDGLPLTETARDVYEDIMAICHPLMAKHKELSPEVVARIRELNRNLDASALEMNSSLIYAFQSETPGSRAFQTRLIELVAVAANQIAAYLHVTEPHRPDNDELASWRPSGDIAGDYCYRDGYPETWFRHEWYRDFDQYPEGIAEGVGYWAESRIFGGVVLFDRREPGSAPDVDPNAVYLHPDRRDVTYRIFRLLDEQKHDLVQFLLSEKSPLDICPLPILGDERNRHRVDPEELIRETGIYRDEWERRPARLHEGDRRLKNVIDHFNYVNDDGWFDANSRARESRDKRLRESP